MSSVYYQIGVMLGRLVNRGRWYYQSLFGSERDALEAEYAVGGNLALKILKAYPAAEDSRAETLIENTGKRLLARLKKTRKFHFYLILHPEINAFALPGGFIFVTAALAELMDDQEIAFVLAHEIGHVVRGHPFDRVLAETSAQMISKIGKSGILGRPALETGERFLKRRYSREQEVEADRFAAEMMIFAGFAGGKGVSALMTM